MPSYVDVKMLRPNSYYHVYTHAVGNERCLLDDRDRHAFIESLRERVVPGLARGRGRRIRVFVGEVSVVAYALMGNHLHFVLHQGRDPRAISRMMHALLGAYARAFNLRHGRDGKLFMKPYHVRHLRNADDVMNAIAYVHNNPRDKKGIDERTSHRAYTGQSPQDFVSTAHGMRFFGNSEGYGKFFDAYVQLKATRETARRNIPV